MGHLTRSYDWEQTPLGNPDTWPQSLRTTLSIILNSRFPMFLFWGPDLLCFYNNAYRPSLGNEGKHPYALGKPAAEIWAEIWDVIKPLIDQVLAGGEAIWSEDQLIPIYRNGQLEDVYWTFSYSPVSDESGKPAGVFVTCSETTEKVISLKRLAESKDQLHFAIEAAELATWSLNPDENKLIGNDRFKEWFGLPAGEEIDVEKVYKEVAEFDRERVKASVRQALDFAANTRKYTVEYTLIHSVTHEERVIRARGKTWFTDEKQAYRFNGILQDVTQEVVTQRALQASEERFRKLAAQLEREVQDRMQELEATNEELAATNEELTAANDELAAINEELAEANQLFTRSNHNLEQFAYVASHDLQEPLRKIQSFGDLLINQYASQLGEGVTYLQRMQSAAGRMSVLIKDLLTFSRISNRQESLTVVSLPDVMKTVLSNLELVIAETNAQISIDPLPNVQGDKSQLGQLFQNLLSNALKFRHPTTSPQIAVRCQTLSLADLPISVKPSSWAAAYYQIDVSDNGVGFDPKYTDRIFQVFQRLHSRQHYTGTGIGLAICERVATNHGGTITATSQPNQGSTFSVYLPV